MSCQLVCQRVLRERDMSQAHDDDAGAATVRVRAATKDDMLTIHRMIYDLAAYEGVPDGPNLTVEQLVQDGFESSPAWFFALVAERGEQTVGFALCNRAYSSWKGRAFYIEDLFVRADARRAGVGTLLLAHIAQLAMEVDVHRIDWHVLESNAPACAFYAGLGARDLRRSEGLAALRLDREHIARLALQTHHTASAHS